MIIDVEDLYPILPVEHWLEPRSFFFTDIPDVLHLAVFLLNKHLDGVGIVLVFGFGSESNRLGGKQVLRLCVAEAESNRNKPKRGVV